MIAEPLIPQLVCLPSDELNAYKAVWRAVQAMASNGSSPAPREREGRLQRLQEGLRAVHEARTARFRRETLQNVPENAPPPPNGSAVVWGYLIPG